MRFRIYVKVKVSGFAWKPCLYACPSNDAAVPALMVAIEALKSAGVPIWSEVK